MKKLLLLLIIPLFFACGGGDDDKSDKQTFFVNVFSQYSPTDKEEIASPVLVYLYKDNGKTIDNTKSYNSVFMDQEITYTDGTTDSYMYISDLENGINTFKNIPNGKYILFVMYLSYNRLKYGASHKNIIVNNDYNMKSEKKVFLYRGISGGNYGYQDWNAKW